MEKKNLIPVSVILVAGMILSSFILSKFFLKIRHEENITVKGFAQTEMKSDVGKLRFSVVRQENTLQKAYQQIEKDKKIVIEYLEKKGLQAENIESTGLYTYDVKERNEKGMYTNRVVAYDATQNMKITSDDVELIKKLSEDLTSLIEAGVNIRVNEPQYYISDLQEVKIDLLVKATEDGYMRAKKLAAGSGADVGALVSASQGVFQITEPNSMETSGYGMYNTSSIMKSVKAVVTLSYAVK
jgi:hypothetical protein